MEPTNSGMKSHAARVTSSSREHRWRTPAKLIDRICEHFGPIKLDPSADHRKRYQFAECNYTGKAGSSDGLALTWRGRGLVYCNPPYGRELKAWVGKAVEEFGKHSAVAPSDQLILLTPARPDTKWFHEQLLKHATAVCFLKGRLSFGNDAGVVDPAAFPSMLCYFGSKPRTFIDTFATLGWTLTLGEQTW